jgi:3-hydroxyisobutyrate dehydrogenase-like beta-hydroxyacid dehydrogenase
MDRHIGFIGLGNLGLPVAGNLLEAGYALTVYNRTASKAAPLAARGAGIAAVPADVLISGGIVVSLLWDTEAVEGMVNSPGFLARLGPGGIHIVMCTGSPESVRRLAQLHHTHGCFYVEAPVFGRPEAAVARKLWIPFTCARAVRERVRPVLMAMGAQEVFDFGEDTGAATIVKLAGNFLIISAVRSLAEALEMTGKAGVDVAATVDMLTQTLFPAPIYQSYGKLIAEGKVSFSQSDIARKDIGLFQDAARQADSPQPIARMLRTLLESAPSPRAA